MAKKLIPTWEDRLSHLEKPTDFAEAQAAKMEAADLRRYISDLEEAQGSDALSLFRRALLNIYGDTWREEMQNAIDAAMSREQPKGEDRG
ncbi:hypothetical protein [Cupriavidus sp. D384]|uniref:hypothetical protein n=1 Tax=Cupriavidus sp. D384 TaxID=1538095 RepID=UPI000836A985|nr:hypothetical protein [Cupriavidus sp. D384]